jgi:DNA-binding transcriptional regulator YiaG
MPGMKSQFHWKNLDGAKIKAFRLKLNLSQQELSSMIGTGYTTVNRWENGHQKPNRSMLKALHAVLMKEYDRLTKKAEIPDDFLA